MTVKHVWLAFVLGAAVAACTKDTGGTLTNPTPVAYLRYFNAVPDTGNVDFRVVDIVGYAPNQVQASFRTGGNPSGIATTFYPPYQAVQAGTRHIRVFLDGTTIATAGTILLDTTYAFTAGTYYTFYAYGYANSPANGTPKMNALITVDTMPTLAAGKIAVRILDLAPDLTGNPAGVTPALINAQVGATTSAVPLPVTTGLPVVATNLGAGQMSGYAVLDSSGTATPYRLAVMAGATTSPVLFQAVMPIGVRGTSSANPIAGTAVAGTSVTAVILPRSAPVTAAPQSTPAAVTASIDSVTRSNDTVTVWRSITLGDGVTTCNAPVAVGTSAADILVVSGINQPEYNGSQVVASVTAGAKQNALSRQSITIVGGSGSSTYRLILNPGTSTADTTVSILWNADSATVRAALAARAAINGNANVGVAGAVGGPYTVTFKGSLANTTVASMDNISTAGFGVAIATLPIACTGTATPSRFRYRVAGTPVSPATGAASYKVVTSANEYRAPTIIFLIDLQPPLTAP